MPTPIPCAICKKPYVPTRPGRTKHATCYQSDVSARAAVRDLVEPADGYAKSVRIPIVRQHPTGWEPHVEEKGDTATAISQPLETASPDERSLIEGWGLDPNLWRIVGPLNCRRWQTNVPVVENGKTVGYDLKWLHYFKANLERIDPVKTADLERLYIEIRDHVPTPIAPPRGGDGFVVTLADPQMGKSDGDGVEGTVYRGLRSIDSVEGRITELRSIGRELGTLYLLGMGDLIENCDGHYPQQAFRTQLNIRDQVGVMRRLIVQMLHRWAPLFDRVVVAAVGGNHGEPRRDGKSYTDFADNYDLSIFDQVEDVLNANPTTYGHVKFRIPKDEISLTLDIAGEVVGMTHGHVIKTSKATASKKSPEASTIAKRVVDWWAQQAHGQQPIGDARILFTAHYHHLLITESGSKTHFQCPALEGGSDWWRNTSGQESRPGLLTLRIGKNVSPAGWADPEVL